MTEGAVTTHFGEWVQGRLGHDGPVVLVTLPCPAFRVTVPGAESAPFRPDVLDRFADRLRLDRDAMRRGVERSFPVGVGGGASTGALVALAVAAEYDDTPDRLAEACIEAEGASDPLMYPHPDQLLWASRQGIALRRMAPPPPADILGGLWGPPVPTDPADTDYDDVSDLIADWTMATERGDLADLAAIASLSARRCTARRGPPDPMEDLARDLRALGMVRAHTGSARGLVFAPGSLPTHGADALREAGLTAVMQFETGGA